MTELVVPKRFCGPPSSGNGGWTSGTLAGLHLAATAPATPDTAVTVQLRMPPPLDTPLDVSAVDDWTLATFDGATVVRARDADGSPAVVEPVTAATARAASATYAGHTSHPFPTCFVCGTDRAPGDGMRIFPGRVDDDSTGAVRLATTWTPGRSPEDVSPALTWAALDCIGGWAGDLAERMMVLGSMTAQIHASPEPGVEHVVVGGARGQDGRKTFTAASLYDPAGRLVASAEHIWFAVDPQDFA